MRIKIKFVKEFTSGPLEGLQFASIINTSDPTPWLEMYRNGGEKPDVITGNRYKIVEVSEVI